MSPALDQLAGSVLRVVGQEALYALMLFLIVLGLTRLLRGTSPVLRHALWGLVFLRLILPTDLSLPFSVGRLAGDAPLPVAVESAWLDAWSLPEAAPALGWGDGPGVTAGPAGRGIVEYWKPAVLALWLLGVAVVGFALTRRRRRYRAIVRRSGKVTDPGVRALAERWKAEFGVRRSVRLVTSEAVRSPFTVGSARPAIFLPGAVLRSGEPGLVESVLAHEMAHIKRWDDLWLRARLAVSALYFFHPVAWLSSGRMREESERICDDLVLSRGRLDAKTYGRSILAALKLGLADEPGVAPALMDNRRKLRARLETIMKRKRDHRHGRRAWYPLPTAVLLGLVLLPMAGGNSGPASAQEPTPRVLEGEGQAGDRAFRYRLAYDFDYKSDFSYKIEDRYGFQIRVDAQVELSNPMPGSRVSAGWGPMVNPFTKKEVHHRGIDLVGGPGAEVLAAADGLVEEATTDYAGGAAHGTVVILDHGNGLKTFYSHLAGLSVSKGDWVASGDVLGTQGSTGKVTGPHLHFEVWVRGEYQDPALYLADWREGRNSFRM